MSISRNGAPGSDSRTPFRVRIRFTANFLKTFLESFRAKAGNDSKAVGLLLGLESDGLVTVQAFRPFQANGTVLQGAQNSKLEYALAQAILDSKADPALAQLAVVGWYKVRANGRRLLEEEISFHNRHFRELAHLALIAHFGGGGPFFEVYTRPPDGPLSIGSHCRVALRVGAEALTSATLECTMHRSVTDDFYLRAYQVTRALDRSEKAEEWKRIQGVAKEVILSVCGFRWVPANVRRVLVIVLLAGTVAAVVGTERAKLVATFRSLFAASKLALLHRNAPAGLVKKQTAVDSISAGRVHNQLAAPRVQAAAASTPSDAQTLPVQSGPSKPLDSARQEPSGPAKEANPSAGGLLRLTASKNPVIPASKPPIEVIQPPNEPRSEAVAEARPSTGRPPDVAPPPEPQLPPVIPQNGPQGLEPATQFEKTAMTPPPAVKEPETHAQPASAAQTSQGSSGLPAAPDKEKESERQNGVAHPSRSEPTVSADALSLSTYLPPRPLNQPRPNLGTIAPNVLTSPAHIEILVKVDTAGRVKDAQVLDTKSHGVRGFLTQAALSAARHWTFEPATLHGQKVESDHTIVFEFQPREQ